MPRLVVCPGSPLLATGDATGDVPEVAAVRAAAASAVARLVADVPARVVVLAEAGPTHPSSAGGTLRPWGVDVSAGGADDVLGLGQTIGAWLLDRAGHDGPRLYTSDATQLRPDDAILVVADGTATRTERAPGHLDERAAAFDEALARALDAGDADALARTDLTLAETLWCRGAATLAAVGAAVRGRISTSALIAHDAPLGVAWFVAEWTLD